MKKRILWLLLPLLLLITACGTTELTPPEESSGNEKPTEAITEPPREPLSVIAEGKSDYVIVYSADDLGEFREIAESLQKKVKDYFGAELSVATDAATAKREILIGAVNRAESRRACEELRANDWSVTVDGERILLSGTEAASVERALKYLLEKVIYVQGRPNQTRSLTLAADFCKVFQYSYYLSADFRIGGTPLRDYTIVYSSDSLYSYHEAVCLRELIFSRSGYRLDYISDRSAAGKHEIRIGMTAKTESADPGRFAYSIRETGGNLEISFTGMHAKEQAHTYFDRVLLAKNAESIPTDYAYTKDISADLSKGEELVLEHTGDVRLIVSNIQSSGANYGKRMEFLRLLFEEYRPDAIGLQEGGNTYARAEGNLYERMAKIGYSEVPTKQEKLWNYTPILYNTKTLKVLDSGYLRYGYSDAAHPTVTNNGNSKSVTWAYFEVLKTGKRFVFFSTHCYYDGTAGDTVGGNLARCDNVRELSELCGSLKAKYQCPIFGGGDMNFHQNTDPYRLMLEKGFVNSRTVADKPGVRFGSAGNDAELNKEYDTFVKVPDVSATLAGEIDMIFCFGNGYRVSAQSIMKDDFACYGSDHCPNLVDIKLN